MGVGVGWAQSVREVHSKGGGGNAISSSIGSVARVRGGGGGGTLKARLSCEALPKCLFNYGILGIKNLIVKYNGYFLKL